jgi:F0F1-type ATP synthase assembly protein I
MKTDYAVFGVYRTQSEIDKAIAWLKSLGCNLNHVSTTYPEQQGPQAFGSIQGTRIQQGLLAGTLVGSMIGAVVGLLITTGVIPLSGFGHFSPFGISLGFILGIVIGGLAGAACGSLVGIGVPESVGKRYRSYLKDGGILLSIHLNTNLAGDVAPSVAQHGEVKRVSPKDLKHVLEMTGGQDVMVTEEDATWDEISKT